MRNSKYQYHVASRCTHHLLSSPSCSTRAIQNKHIILNEKCWESSGENFQGNGPLAEQNDKTKRLRELGIKTVREEIGKGNQITALGLHHTGAGHQTSDIPGLPLRERISYAIKGLTESKQTSTKTKQQSEQMGKQVRQNPALNKQTNKQTSNNNNKI